MNDGILSQQEIDALLAGEPKKTAAPAAFELSDFERDALGEIGNISMGTSATILSTLLRRKVSITTPSVNLSTRERVQTDFTMPYLIVEVQYREGLHGTNVFVVKTEDACIIADLMMGVEPGGPRSNLTEIELSAVGEAMNQMMGSATTSLSTMFNTRIDICPPVLTVVNMAGDLTGLHTSYKELVTIKFQMVIENLLESEIMQIIPIEAVKHMMDMLTGNVSPPDFPPQVAAAADTIPCEPASISVPESRPAVPTAASQQMGFPAPNAAPVKPAPPELTVQPVQFASLHEFSLGSMPQNIGLILDVPLDVSVELGKARKSIKDVLELQQGSIIQLDKMAGEPVDLIVNGKLIARGEVVVIDENYGIRITAIISPVDRVNKLQ